MYERAGAQETFTNGGMCSNQSATAHGRGKQILTQSFEPDDKRMGCGEHLKYVGSNLDFASLGSATFQIYAAQSKLFL